MRDQELLAKRRRPTIPRNRSYDFRRNARQVAKTLAIFRIERERNQRGPAIPQCPIQTGAPNVTNAVAPVLGIESPPVATTKTVPELIA